MGTNVRVARTADVPAGSGLTVELEDRSFAIFNIGGTFYAIDNTCAHRGGPLGEGDVDGAIVTCPWHAWQYDVTTGKCVNNPAACVKSYPVQVDGDNVNILL